MSGETRFRCPVCLRLTAGRIPRERGASGDKSFRFPRRHHDANGQPCPGNVQEAEWIDVPRRAARAEAKEE